MADPRIFSLDVEDAYYQQLVQSQQPFVHKEDRMQNNYPGKFPLGIDRYRTDFKKPTLNMRQIDADSLRDDLQNGFNRTGYEAHQQWAFAPADNYYEFNIAKANGHPSGRVGYTGELVTEDIDLNLNGGYLCDLDHADLRAARDVLPPNKLRY